MWPWVLAATVVAAALRLYGVGEWSLWIDEAHTFRDATLPLEGESTFWRQDRAFYPLTYLCLRWLLEAGWVGADEGSLRLPFVVVGIATVPLMWWWGRRLVGVGAAVVAAWVLALMPWHVFWSQNARGYVCVVFTAVVATGLAWRWAETGRRRHLALALAAIALGALFHPTSWFQAFGLVAFVAARRLHNVSVRVVFVAAVAVVGVLAALPFLVETLSPIQGFLREKTDRSVLHLVTTVGYYFRPVLLLAAVAGCLLLRRRLGRDRALLLACLVVVPFVVLAVLGGALVKTTARYAICALPAAVWLAAAGVAQLAAAVSAASPTARPSPGLRLLAAFLGVALLVDFTVEGWRYYVHRHGDRARWREACTWIETRYAGQRVDALTINEPSVAYCLTPEIWRDRGAVEGPCQVLLLADWMVHGLGPDEEFLHPPGWSEHLRWRRARAARSGAQLVVLLKRPELDEIDTDGTLWRSLRADFELALYLPCWVGPKDESVWVFVPTGP